MLAIPEITRIDIAFGNISHMPKYETLPEPFKDWHHNEYCRDITAWFYKGAKSAPDGIELDGKAYVAKPGVKAGEALAAIKAVLGSLEPKHEHKIAACGYMLSEWFEKSTVKPAA